MKVIITSGGTSEAIDQVRAITNHSTGSLGKALAEYFLDKGDQVSLVTTKRALKPEAHPNLSIQLIESVSDLKDCLEELVPSHDALIHAMAVSDYRPVYMTDIKELEEAANVRDFLNKRNQESKISSDADTQVLFLQKNPKIISLIKEWKPDIQLIGFKLLVGVEKQELIQVARASLIKNRADLIVANDLLEVTSNSHKALLVQENRVDQAENRLEIAQKIYAHIHKESL